MLRISRNLLQQRGGGDLLRPFSIGLISNSSSNNNNNNQDNNNAEKHSNEVTRPNPIKRTFQILRDDMHKVKDYIMPRKSASSKKATVTGDNDDDAVAGSQLHRYAGVDPSTVNQDFQTHCDVLVIGGGGVGSSVAYWLKRKARHGLNVVVVERDTQYTRASTVLSVGGLRQQFSLPENIQMSLFAADFMRDAKENLGDVSLNFTPYGYLTLATDEGAETLKRNSELQIELGARNELLTAKQLKAKFPWINTDGIALGCHGLEKEGWFDPWALLMGYRQKAREYGAFFVDGEVVNFGFENMQDVVVEGASSEGQYESLDRAVVRLPNGEQRTIKFALCVIAGGAFSGELARMARIGCGPGLLSIPLPVEPRKRYVYVFNSQGANAPGLGTPLTIDPDGTYFRRDGLGGNYICGRSPPADREPATDNLDVDHDYFQSDVWPTLAHRVPAFESAKVCASWAGYYEYNMFDENGIIGAHPYYHNLYLATGFSGHGIQQTPAVGRALSELIVDGCFRTIDLTRLGFDRIIVDQPMFEANIV